MKTIIIDGTNVVRRWFELHGNRDFVLEQKLSEHFLKIVSWLNRKNEYRVEVYFDGPKRVLQCGSNITILFSKDKKADDLIVNSVYETVCAYKEKALVITQDNALMERCRQYGSYIKTASLFLREMQSALPQYA